MSDGTRIPLAEAKAVADRLFVALGMREPEARVVGSVRREKPDVGDIEIIAPAPATEMDWLFQAIGKVCLTPEDEGSMFPRSGTIGKTVKGWKPGFAYCQLLLDSPAVKVDIFRYQPGNRGWIELMRTGPADYSERVLIDWKRKCGTLGTPKPGSVGGFLVDSMGNPRNTPTERSVFDLIGIPFVEPKNRTQGETTT